jgi:hypothetical protein
MGDAPQNSEAAPRSGTIDCPLEGKLQIRNCRIYAAQISLTYLAAPTLYVGFVQAGLCKRLHTSDTIANLPSTVYLAMTGVPVLVTWLYPEARQFKPIMARAYGLMALIGLLLAAVLLAPVSSSLTVGALLVHAAVLGAGNGITNIMGWEALNRGVSAQLRGKALGLAFGWGPAFAVLGSLGAQLLLDGKVFGWAPPVWASVGYPFNYAFLFAVGAICSGFCALLVRLYRIPIPTVDVERESFSTAIVGGLKAFLRSRVLLIASIAYLLMYCGNLVQTNMSLFTHEAVGRMSEDLVGYQLTLRFSFKILAGFFLGWLLARTNPKAPLLVTAGLLIAGVLWVLFAPGYWFLLAFGINGAGELFGVYYMNYPVQCSPTSQVRRNIAFLSLVSALVGFAPVMYGWISDTWSLRASFWVALAVLIFTALLVSFKLPAHPKPRPEEMTDADRAAARVA